jgi:L-aminopeptidase/D-esterase-like protein
LTGQITDVPGVTVGCVQDHERMTGVTVILCEAGAAFVAKKTGPATTTRQIDGGRLDHMVTQAHAFCLAGGSGFGLGASTGVMKYLSERGIGHRVRNAIVPTVPTAALFDMGIGYHGAWPDADMAFRACLSAGKNVPRGSYGAGCGATVGKALGPEHLMKGGQGTSSVTGQDGVVIGALAAVNAYGDIVDAETGEHLAGARDPAHPGRLAGVPSKLGLELRPVTPSPIENTTLAIVAVGASLDKAALARVANMAASGFARAMYPAHCVFDGDILFVLATGGAPANENLIGHLAALALARAIADAVRCADGFGKIPDRSSLDKVDFRA